MVSGFRGVGRSEGGGGEFCYLGGLGLLWGRVLRKESNVGFSSLCLGFWLGFVCLLLGGSMFVWGGRCRVCGLVFSFKSLL